MPEGLFHPNELDLPKPVRDALPAVVRVYTKIRFRVRLYSTQTEVEEARAAPDAFGEETDAAGGVTWPFHISMPELLDLRADPLRSIQAGRYEVVQALADVNAEDLRKPLECVTAELAGSASGFLVGHREGRALIATNYHVAREAVARAGREGGVSAFAPTQTPDLRIGVSSDGHQTGRYRLVDDVELVANASREDWKRGLDWALLSIPAGDMHGVRPLPFASHVEAGVPVWALGFPVRSQRREPRGYRNADDTFRISTGHLTRPEPDDSKLGWRADLDGLSGSSGSAVVNASGEVTGLFRNHTHYDYPATGPVDRRFVEFGGEAQLAPVTALQDMLAR